MIELKWYFSKDGGRTTKLEDAAAVEIEDETGGQYPVEDFTNLPPILERTMVSEWEWIGYKTKKQKSAMLVASRLSMLNTRMKLNALQGSEQVSDGDRKNPDNWITMNGRKIFIEKGQSKDEAAKNFLDKEKGKSDKSKEREEQDKMNELAKKMEKRFAKSKEKAVKSRPTIKSTKEARAEWEKTSLYKIYSERDFTDGAIESAYDDLWDKTDTAYRGVNDLTLRKMIVGSFDIRAKGTLSSWTASQAIAQEYGNIIMAVPKESIRLEKPEGDYAYQKGSEMTRHNYTLAEKRTPEFTKIPKGTVFLMPRPIGETEKKMFESRVKRHGDFEIVWGDHR